MYIAELQLKVKDSPLPNRRAALAALRPEGSKSTARLVIYFCNYKKFKDKSFFCAVTRRGAISRISQEGTLATSCRD
jgi:hypothetical protein